MPDVPPPGWENFRFITHRPGDDEPEQLHAMTQGIQEGLRNLTEQLKETARATETARGATARAAGGATGAAADPAGVPWWSKYSAGKPGEFTNPDMVDPATGRAYWTKYSADHSFVRAHWRKQGKKNIRWGSGRGLGRGRGQRGQKSWGRWGTGAAARAIMSGNPVRSLGRSLARRGIQQLLQQTFAGAAGGGAAGGAGAAAAGGGGGIGAAGAAVAAAGAGGGGGGVGAALAGAAGAMGGPVGLAVAGVVLLGTVAVMAARALNELTDGQLKYNRQLGEASAQMAAVFARRDMQELLRNREKGDRLASSAQQLTEAEQFKEDQSKELSIAWNRMTNEIATEWEKFKGMVMAPLNAIVGVSNKIHDWLTGDDKEKSMMMDEWARSVSAEVAKARKEKKPEWDQPHFD